MNNSYFARQCWIREHAVLLAVAFILLLADQLTKALTYFYLPPMGAFPHVYPYGGVGIFHDFFGVEFSLNYMSNHGAACGILSDYQTPLLFLRIVLILGLIVYQFCFNMEKKWHWPLILIITGAIGNVCDYFIYGHVIDMFHFILWGFDFPVFNLADAYISIGVGLLIILSWIP